MKAMIFGLAVGGIIIFMILARAASASPDDIQVFNFGAYKLYIPKHWLMTGTWDATLSDDNKAGGTKAEWRTTTAEPLEADALLMVPDNPAVARDWDSKLAKHMRLTYREHRGDLSKLIPPIQHTVDAATSLQPGEDCFVRTWPRQYDKPGKPTYEEFICKGYRNKVGQPLIIHSFTMRDPYYGETNLSDVTIAIETNLSLRYQFSSKDFPENTWFDLYQHMVEFVDYLQKPK
jgi:hypothetical protein